MNNEISRTAVRAHERGSAVGDVRFVLVSLDVDGNPADVACYTRRVDADASAATVLSWAMFIFQDGEPQIWKTDRQSTRDLASRNDAKDDRPLGIGVEVIFRVSVDMLEVGTIAEENPARANGPQALTTYRVNDGAGVSAGWFTADELERHNRPTTTHVETKTPTELLAQAVRLILTIDAFPENNPEKIELCWTTRKQLIEALVANGETWTAPVPVMSDAEAEAFADDCDAADREREEALSGTRLSLEDALAEWYEGGDLNREGEDCYGYTADEREAEALGEREREEAIEAEDARLERLGDAGIAALDSTEAERKAIDAGLAMLGDSLRGSRTPLRIETPKDPSPWKAAIFHTRFAKTTTVQAVHEDSDALEMRAFDGIKVRSIDIDTETCSQALDKAFELGQNDFEPREAVRMSTPSCSVGDVIRIFAVRPDGSSSKVGDWRVAKSGFEPLNETEKPEQTIGERCEYPELPYTRKPGSPTANSAGTTGSSSGSSASRRTTGAALSGSDGAT